MKLCPQCAFIYEDDQKLCDMDGKELILQPAPAVPEQKFARLVITTPSATPTTKATSRTGRSWRNLALVIGAVVILAAALAVAVYFARVYQTRARGYAQPSASSADRLPVTAATQPAADNSVQSPAANTASTEPTAEQLSAKTEATSSDSASSSPSRVSLAHTRANANPVSAGGSGKGRGPVLLQLSNGAAIRADEAWDKKEGIWYRQAGMVTFLKRSQVRTIERLPAPAVPKADEKNRTTENGAARNQLRLARLEPVDQKSQSRVTSFLKKTGRILKKPFKP